MENVDGALDAEVVQLAADFEVQQVVLWAEQEQGQEEARRKADEQVFPHAAVFSTLEGPSQLTTVRYCSICPSTLPSLNWSLYCGRPMSSSHPAGLRGEARLELARRGTREMPACALGTYE